MMQPWRGYVAVFVALYLLAHLTVLVISAW